MVAIGIALGVTAAGLTAAQLRAAGVAAPALERGLDFVAVEGRIDEIEPTTDGARLILSDVRIKRLAPEATPARVRVRVRGEEVRRFRLGERVAMSAGLIPPPGPAAPGAFDFQRAAWFKRIGAVGFSFGMPAGVIGGWRQWVFDRVTAVLEPPTAAVAAALLTGKRSEG